MVSDSTAFFVRDSALAKELQEAKQLMDGANQLSQEDRANSAYWQEKRQYASKKVTDLERGLQ